MIAFYVSERQISLTVLIFCVFMRAFFTANRVSLGGSLWTTYLAGMLPKDLESQLVESSKCANKEIFRELKKIEDCGEFQHMPFLKI